MAVIVLAASLLLAPATHAQMSADEVEALADSVAQAALDGALPGAPAVAGISIGIARDGEPVLMKGYGYASLEDEYPMEAGTVTRIGSITKPFSAAAILMLEERGALSLDDDIAQWFPSVEGEGITIRHLLDHTSGIPSFTSQRDWLQRAGDTMTRDEMLEWIESDSLEFAPGSTYRYNNSGYYLLGVIIEEVSGMEYEAFLSAEIMDPLGMTSTYYCPDEPTPPAEARGYAQAGESPLAAQPVSMTQPFAAGGLCSTVEDLLRFSRALMGGDLLTDASLEKMTTRSVTSDADTSAYGLGIGVNTREGHRSVGHGGGIQGFVSQWIDFPDDAWTITVLTNTEGAAAYQAEQAISRVLLDLPMPDDRDIALAPEVLAQYEGRYDIGVTQLHVYLEEDQLYAQAPGQSAFPIFPIEEDVFRADIDPSLRFHFTVEDGMATHLHFQQSGQSFEGDRVEDDAEADEDAGESLPDDAEERYVGTYDLGPLVMTIFMKDGQMMGQVAGQGAFPLVYRGKDRFGASFDPTLELVFKIAASGHAEHLTLHQQGQWLEGPRQE